MKIHVIDGTYELFRAYYGAPPQTAPDGRPVGGVAGILRSFLGLLRESDVTHVGVAFDQVIESFRNEMFPGYKTGEGIEPELLEQFPLAETGARALGMTVWPMVEFEADDALATAVARWKSHPRVEQIIICTPDKDLCQCVEGRKVVALDRRKRAIIDEAGVVEKFGVPPHSIPDYLGLVGDTADGIPGIPRWGAKTSATVLARYGSIDNIPDDENTWEVEVRGKAALAANLRERREDSKLYRQLAVLRTDVPLTESLDDLEWKGALRDAFPAFCEDIGDAELLDRVHRWREDDDAEGGQPEFIEDGDIGF